MIPTQDSAYTRWSALTDRAGRSTWIGPAQVVFAALALALAIGLFLTIPLRNLPLYAGHAYFVLDATSMLFLMVICAVYLGISVYMLSRDRDAPEYTQDIRGRSFLTILFMLLLMAAVMANHLVLLWGLLELSTACAALMMINGQRGAPPEVAWRYLLYSSLALGIALLGMLCLTQSALARGVEMSFHIDRLPAALARGPDAWQRLGLSLILLGLGGKLGLVPLYSWLPETYEAAPTSTSALLAAVQFNISIVAVFRVLQVFRGVDAGFAFQELLFMGYGSLLVAAIQIMAVRNYKRLIAYACISSSGVIALGLSVGKVAAYGVVLYVVSNAFVKALLFLTAGRFRSVYKTHDVASLDGVIRVMPTTGLLFTGGIFALLGLPPFASFLSEMLILSGIVQAGNILAFTLMCVLLTLIFVATGRTVFPMLWGTSELQHAPVPASLAGMLPKLAFVGVLTMLGTYTPAPITDLIRAVAVSIGGG